MRSRSILIPSSTSSWSVLPLSHGANHRFRASTPPAVLLMPYPKSFRSALSGWALQLASGAVFGAVSWHFYGQFPDIHGIAIAALVLKVLCALVALVLIALSLYARPLHDGRRSTVTWRLLATLGGTALTGAAFLRWFS